MVVLLVKIVEYIQIAYDFMGNAYKEFIAAIMQEVPKQTFVDVNFLKPLQTMGLVGLTGGP